MNITNEMLECVREKLSQIYHEYLNDRNNELIKSRLSVILELAESIKNKLLSDKENDYEEYIKYVNKVSNDFYWGHR